MCFALLVLLGLGACGDDDGPGPMPDAGMPDAGMPDGGPIDGGPPPVDIDFPMPGPTSGAMGIGSFRFGAATAATQIEDMNENTDWYLWTRPKAEGGLGHGVFVGDAVQGYTHALDDIALVTEMNLDAYRFSVEWPRVEPMRDVVDEAALAHYDEVVDALVAANVTPMITVHHFSNPLWVDDPRIANDCPGGPTATQLCGWHHETGGPLIVEEIAEHARLLAERYGDRVDDWMTLNEPVNYLLAAYGTNVFPPGRNLYIGGDIDAFGRALRNMIAAHAAMYDAIKAADTVDADGDGVAASVGFTLNVIAFVPARGNRPSTHPDDIAAVERVRYVYHYLFPGSILDGTFDADADMTGEEMHPEWRGKLDWLGIQYYPRVGVSGQIEAVPLVRASVCFGGFDLGACLPPEDPTHWVPAMRYEYWEPGIYEILMAFSERWPDLPMTVTEAGIATEVGVRRAEHVVRTLEMIQRAIEDGADVRGYLHWSLMDNFEWAEGYEPRFGLYRVDRTMPGYPRTATEGATVLGAIAAARRLTVAQREQYGGLGPMTPEEGAGL